MNIKTIILLVTAVLLACHAVAGDLKTWDTSAGGNNDAPPDGFPEGMQQNTFNDAARETMAAVRRFYDDPQYININRGNTVSRTGTSELTVAGVDLTAYYTAGRRVRHRIGAGAWSTSRVSSSAFTAGNTVVTLGSTVLVGTNDLEVYALSLIRQGAFTETGTAIGELATHSATGPLLTGAYKNHGNTVGDLALHSSTGPLLTGAYKAHGNTVGDLALHAYAGPLKQMAYRDLRARTRTITSSDPGAITAGAGCTVIPQLSNIAVPGSPNGSLIYQVSALVQIENTDSTADEGQLEIKVGPSGDNTDTTVVAVKYGLHNGSTEDEKAVAIPPFQFVPAAADKISLCLDNAQTETVKGASPLFSWMLVEQVWE